jgi:hypothetical protein
MTEETGLIKEKVDLIKELTHEEKERDIEVTEEGQGSGTLSERMSLEAISDMQSAQASLFPDKLGGDILNKVMISRIAPDMFNPMLRLMTLDDILSSDSKKPIDVNAIVIKNYILTSIGLDGRGRVDLIELAGASREAEELKELGGGMV